jgi:hypothetical protein
LYRQFKLAVIGLIVAFATAHGTTVSAQTSDALPPTIRTIAGRIGLGEGGPATEASLPEITAVAVDGLGRVLVSTSSGFQTGGDNRVHRIGLDGIITPVAGNGRWEVTGPVTTGMVATTVALPSVISLLGLPDGSFLFGSTFGVFKVRADGVLESFANSARGFQQCEPPADNPTTLSVCEPRSLALGPDGTVYIADAQRNSVFAVSPTGVVRRFAGVDHSGVASLGDGGPATSATIKPIGVAVSGTNVYIGQYPFDLRRVGSNGIIETVATNSNRLPPAPGTDPSETIVYGVFGQTASGGILLYGPRGALNLRADGLTEALVSGYGATADPDAGGFANTTYAGRTNTAAGAPDGSIVIAQNETNEVYRIATNGRISRIAGRRYSSTVPANQLSLVLTTSVATTSDGSVLLSEGISSSRVWRLRNGQFSLLAGSLKPTEPGANRNLATRRLFDVPGVSEGCNGSVYLKDIFELIRIDPSGFLSYPRLNASSPLEVTSVAGTCGATYALDYAGRLLRINPDDTVSVIDELTPYSALYGSDGSGGLILKVVGVDGLSRRVSDGTISSLFPISSAAATFGGYAGTQYTVSGPFFSTLRDGVVDQIARLEPGLPVAGPQPVDGLVSAAPFNVSRLAANPHPSQTITILDRSFLRVLKIARPREAAGSSQANPASPRSTAPPVVVSPSSNRTPAPPAT